MNKEILFKLADLIKKRRLSNREDSYVKSLLEDGTKKIIEASLEDNEAKKKKVIHEMADLWFHTMVLLENEGLELEDILSELETRFGTSGHEEKSSR